MVVVVRAGVYILDYARYVYHIIQAFNIQAIPICWTSLTKM